MAEKLQTVFSPNSRKSGLSKSGTGALQRQSRGFSGIPSMFGQGPPSGVYISRKQAYASEVRSSVEGKVGSSLPSRAAGQQLRFRSPQHVRESTVCIQYHPRSNQLRQALSNLQYIGEEQAVNR
ncbi:hypothetical protein NPIL_122011 [Nephila pilipes]|uniref:Uncharacterized protein n=1 Tax=Nephila pilipes TaxID=299642 RepID=A0A8X6PMJ3_NEPPI|nr:hypothetical protein NPIL_122011 [Nephila pilipes]